MSPVVARGMSLPASMCGNAVGGAAKYEVTRSPSRSCSAGAEPQSLCRTREGSRSGLRGMECKARCAVDSAAIYKRRNAADRPQRPLPEGLERNRAIERPGCLHGH